MEKLRYLIPAILILESTYFFNFGYHLQREHMSEELREEVVIVCNNLRQNGEMSPDKERSCTGLIKHIDSLVKNDQEKKWNLFSLY